MAEEQTKPTPTEICMIRIAFPVVSDEDALAVKKKLSEALKDKSGVQFDFSIKSATRPMMPI